MCTISITPHWGGVRVVCNRDERRERSVALAPAEYSVGGGRAIFPKDPDGGGTWIGVNRHGLVAALLNRNPGLREDLVASGFSRTSSVQASRGVIVPFLLRFDRPYDALAELARWQSAGFAAFRVVLLDQRSIWTAAGGGGLRLQVDRHGLVRPHVFSSSGLGDALVEGPRRRLFQELIFDRRIGRLAAQAAFHRHQWTNATAISVLMARADARTVSRTLVDLPVVGPIVMRYEPLPDIPEGSHVC